MDVLELLVDGCVVPSHVRALAGEPYAVSELFWVISSVKAGRHTDGVGV